MVILANGGQTVAEALLAAINGYQLEVGADEVLVSGDDAETVEFGRYDRFLGRSVAKENVIKAWPVGVFGDSQACGGIALRIGVNYQDFEIVGG